VAWWIEKKGGEAFQIEGFLIFRLNMEAMGRNSDRIGYQIVGFINIHTLFTASKYRQNIVKCLYNSENR